MLNRRPGTCPQAVSKTPQFISIVATVQTRARLLVAHQYLSAECIDGDGGSTHGPVAMIRTYVPVNGSVS